MDKQEIQNLIKDLIEKTGVKTSKIDTSEESGESLWFSVEVSEPHFFINHDGEALHSLNHLIRRIVESKTPKKEDGSVSEINVLVDINGFQKKKIDAVRAVAHMMGERARYFKSSVEIDPMSSFERRIVHEFLSGHEDLKTESVGFGPSRRVVVKYIGTI